MFVTWHSHNDDLRCCLGTLSEAPLFRLIEYAITSSQNDSRFSTISLHELNNLSCILHSLELCAHSLDWEIGHHGIIVEFCVHGSKHQALQEAINETGCREYRSRMSVTRYKASNSSLNHSQYVRYSVL